MKFGASALRFLLVSSTAVYGGAEHDAAANLEGTTRKTLRGNSNPRDLQGKVDIIVTLKVGCSHNGKGPAGNDKAAAAANNGKAADVAVRNGIVPKHLYGTALVGFAGPMPPGRMGDLMTDECVDNIEFDAEVHLDPMEMEPPTQTRRKLSKGGNGKGRNGGGGGSDPAQTTPWGISRVGGGATYTDGKRAWILDTGIDLDHPDLNVDSTNGFSAFNTGGDATFDDGIGHGTHVAGTIAAIDNEIGVVGVAAGATVVPVKVLSSSGSGSYAGVIAGIDHVGAEGQPGDVANMSLGGGFSQAVNDAVFAAAANGIKFILAAGNDSTSATTKSPASANGFNIYTVSASDINNNWAYFSNYGNPPVDCAAPGVSIASTWKDGGYNTISGTSMAAPHAAGCLLVASYDPDTGASTLKTSGTVNGDPDGNADPIVIV